MLLSPLTYISHALDEHLKNQFNLVDRIALLNRIVEIDGSVPNVYQNKVIVTLINTQIETIRPHGRTASTDAPMRKGTTSYVQTVVLSANFDDYLEALKFLDASSNFIEQNALFTTENSSNIPTDIDRIRIEKENLDLGEMKSIWKTLGARMIPFIAV